MTSDPQEILERIYRKDPTLWEADSAEHQEIIRHSLGWIDLVERMEPHLDEIQEFAETMKDHFDHVVLLGMGGSSLCPEVYRRVFGRRKGWPELIVLDSVVPEAVREVEEAIELERTLFIVASKSGSTIEPMSLYKRFHGLLDERGSLPGDHFVAITDPGSPLEKLARERGFVRVFRNFADIGGRYSALSFFGMVPAALAGYDIHQLLARASMAFSASNPRVPVAANPALLLGAMVGQSALGGKNKMTVILPGALESVGLWIEQLVAESTGKEGRGVVPVAGEPELDLDAYGDDRVFVRTSFRGASEDSEWVDQLVGERVVMNLEIGDEKDVTWLFVTWEIATAIMGLYLGINPFDQPNVEEAKVQAKRALAEPPESASGSLDDAYELLRGLNAGDYLTLLVYAGENDDRNATIDRIRAAIGNRFGVATTAGYGPRYLHSTGQLHKGGPDGGVFVIVSQADDDEMTVHGESYTLNQLAYAQAVGDRRALESAGRRVVHLHGPAIDDTLGALAQWSGEL